MTPEERAQVKGIIDTLLPLVRGFWSDLHTQQIEADIAAGELGLALDVILYTVDKESIALPADVVESVRRALTIERLLPPSLNLAELQSFLDRQKSVA